jgi:hypothetical protein
MVIETTGRYNLTIIINQDDEGNIFFETKKSVQCCVVKMSLKDKLIIKSSLIFTAIKRHYS